MKNTKAQWLVERKEKITASDVGTILGFGFEGQSALTVYEDKISDKVHEIEDNPIYMAGHALEDVAARVYATQTGNTVVAGDVNQLLIHPSIPWLACTRDRIVLNPPRPLEIKAMGIGHSVNRHEWKEDPPERQQLQLQIQDACMGADSGILCGFFVPGCEMIAVEKEFDAELFDMILPKLEKFKKCVDNRTPPDPLEFSLGSRELKRIYKTENRQTIALSGFAHDVAINWIRAREERLACEKEEEASKAALLAAMGENSYGALLDGTFIKRSVVERKGYQPKYIEPTSYVKLSHTKKM
jgi:putative phage-type endonuclease